MAVSVHGKANEEGLLDEVQLTIPVVVFHQRGNGQKIYGGF